MDPNRFAPFSDDELTELLVAMLAAEQESVFDFGSPVWIEASSEAHRRRLEVDLHGDTIKPWMPAWRAWMEADS